MAIVALFTEAAFVRLDLLVAVETKAGRLSECHFFKVASVALDVFMRAIEPKIRKSVIECLPVELNDVGSAPLVV